MHKKIKKEIQHQLNKIKLSNEPRQIILSIARYSRGAKSKFSINLKNNNLKCQVPDWSAHNVYSNEPL